jgi:hypothetical protein
MKQLYLVMALLGGASCTYLQAQVLDAHANVPFDFWLGQKLMPAGEYSIYHTSSGVVWIRGEDRERSGAVFLAQRISRPTARDEARLQFTRYGETYFLSEIWNPYQSNGYGVPKSPREKELLAHSMRSKTIGVALLNK